MSILNRTRRAGKKIVFTNGCFDLLHPGHLKVLETAKKAGDLLIVGLNSDSSVKRLKGPLRPILSQHERATLVGALRWVDYVVIFKEDTPLETIKVIKPDVLVKGGDWANNEIVGREYANRVIRVKPVPGTSTTNIIQKMQNAKRKTTV